MTLPGFLDFMLQMLVITFVAALIAALALTVLTAWDDYLANRRRP